MFHFAWVPHGHSFDVIWTARFAIFLVIQLYQCGTNSSNPTWDFLKAWGNSHSCSFTCVAILGVPPFTIWFLIVCILRRTSVHQSYVGLDRACIFWVPLTFLSFNSFLLSLRLIHSCNIGSHLQYIIYIHIPPGVSALPMSWYEGITSTPMTLTCKFCVFQITNMTFGLRWLRLKIDLRWFSPCVFQPFQKVTLCRQPQFVIFYFLIASQTITLVFLPSELPLPSLIRAIISFLKK